MKLSDCNYLCKKALFIILLTAQGINPVYTAPAKGDVDSLQATENSAAQPQLNDEEYQRALEAQLMQEIPRFMIESILHPLFSKIDTLKLVIGNPKSKLSLTLDQKKNFITTLGSINKVLEEHARLFMCTTKKDVMGALALSRHLIAYLSDTSKKGLKNLQPFTFTYEVARAEPTLENIHKNYKTPY